MAEQGESSAFPAEESEGIQSKIQEKRSTSLSRPTSAISLQSSIISGAKPDLHPILKVDERQKLARERRLEREKQLAARESFWLEKEEKARQYYEKHLEERKRKLEEQRIKEEKRRAAVDEKRRQRIEEEKERHEAVVRRTMERSQKSRQKLNRWPWGGALQSNTSIDSSDPDRRSVSTVNLSKHLDPVINKRLSSSSATLLNSPDRARRLQLSPWESSVVSRLLMPTHSFLARSKSTAALSGDSASCSPISPQSYKTVNYRSAERPKLSVMAPEAVGRRRTTHSPLVSSIDKKEKDRENEREQALLNPSFNIKRSHSPSNPKIRSPAPSPVWLPQKTPAFFPGASKQTPSSPSFNKVLSSSQRPPSPGNVRPIKRETQSEKDPEKELEKANEESTECKAPLPATGESATEEMFSGLPESVQAGGLSPAPLPAVPTPSASSKTTAGTTNPEEATRVLSEKRRLAREQREREEQERKEKEEEKRQKKEEMAQRKAEERARREEKALREEAERKQREEEQQREKEEQLQRLAEEKEQRERSEAERLQKQKEEEEVRLQEEAERIRLEREKHFQREEQERLERKKRLEEIMKRTRRSEAADKQSNAQRNGEISKTPEEPDTPPSSLQSEQESQLQYTREVPRNGEPATPAQMLMTHHPVVTVDSTLNTEKQANENGVSVQNDSFEEIINLPVESKPSRLESLGTGGSNNPPINLNPVIAFEETGTLGPLPQVDSVQTQQTAEVI